MEDRLLRLERRVDTGFDAIAQAQKEIVAEMRETHRATVNVIRGEAARSFVAGPGGVLRACALVALIVGSGSGAAAGVGAAASGCNAPKVAEDMYTRELLSCVGASATREASRECKAKVDSRWFDGGR